MKIWIIIVAGICFAASGFCALSDGTLEMRRKLQSQGAVELCKSSTRGDDVSDIQAAFGLLFIGIENETANKRLQKAIIDIGGYDNFSHFHTDDIRNYEKWMAMLLRFYYLFEGKSDNGLNPRSRQMLRDLFKVYIEFYGKISAPLADDVWLINEDEITDITRICALYLAAKAIEDDTSGKWDKYLNQYCLQRAANGLGGVVSPGANGAAALAGMLNVYDFTDNLLLQKRVSAFLDITFADWAQEQFDLIRLGARSNTTLYTSANDSLQVFALPFICRNMNWTIGSSYTDKCSEYIYIAATSDWRMPNVVMDMIIAGGRENFAYLSQRPAAVREAPGGLVRLLPGEGLLTRYSYCTSEYVLGGFFAESAKGFYSRNNPGGYLASIFENSSSGIGFKDGAFILIKPDIDKDAAAPQCIGRNNIMIFQQPQPADYAVALNVHISEGLAAETRQQGSWLIFKNGSTWTALKGLSILRPGGSSGYDWKSDTHFTLKEAASPLVIITSPTGRHRQEYEFIEYITDHQWRIRDAELTYTAQTDDGEKSTFTMSLDALSPQTVNGKSPDQSGMMQFDSPMISSAKDSSIVVIKKDRRKQVYYLKEDRIAGTD
jgi:hypothetical protein